MANAQHISVPSKVLFKKVRKLVPPMLEKFHKGQHGRVAVIGGSLDYTGAPYFSSMASAKLGCDMSHVICESSAATSLASPILNMLSRLHALVIGPGLGRDEVTLKVVTEVMKEARSRSIPFVLDADGLLLVTQDPDLVKGYMNCILTPNVNEFGKLAETCKIDVPSLAQISKDDKGGDKMSRAAEACEKLSQALGGVTIIQKGPHDVISNGITSIISDVEGGLKRSGGQGDTLTGSLGTLLGWRAAYHEPLWDSGEQENSKEAQSKDEIQGEIESGRKMSPKTSLLLAAWAGSCITRECSRRAYTKKGRSMQASDLTEEVHEAFLELIGEPEGSKVPGHL
ncbi:Ribokinase-like protein [Aspergillus unguis]